MSVVQKPVDWQKFDFTYLIDIIRRTTHFDADLIFEILEYAKRHKVVQPKLTPPDGEGWYGHKFKEGTRGIWRCDCGKQLTDGENKCTNGTQNTLQSQPLTADAEDTQTHADTYPEREAHALSTPEVVSHEAQQVAVPVPLTDGEIDAVTIAQWGEMHGQPLAAHRAFARAIEARLGITQQGDAPCNAYRSYSFGG